MTQDIERYAARAEDLAESGRYAWWAGLAALLRSQAETITTLRAERDALAKAMTKIDAIRNSIIGFQNVGWSEHIYPLVAALEYAGYRGEGYDKGRESVRTLLAAEERATTAEARAVAWRELVQSMREALEPFGTYLEIMPDLDNKGNPLPDEQGMGWVYLTIADFRRARAALSRSEV